MTDTTKLADVLANARAELGASGHYSEPVASILDAADNLVAALRAAPAAEIPREPTQAMIDAAFVVYDGMRPGSFSAEMTRMWRAMHDAAINGPAACSGAPTSPSTEGVGSAGSGAAPVEGLDDAIAWSLEHMPIMDSPGAPDWAGRHVHALTTAASAYQEAAAELARVKGERDDAVAMLRVVGEETVRAGLPGGDRNVTLANVRALTAERKRSARLEALLVESRGHLHGYKMSMLARTRESLVTAIDAALTPTAKEQT